MTPDQFSSAVRVTPCNSTSTGTYAGAELTSYARPGAADAMALPSRMNDRLHYRDGRVTDMQGNPITQP